MSSELNQDELNKLVNLLLISSKVKAREALCISIGIDYYRQLGFINDPSDDSFAINLINHLNEVGNTIAICQLCCNELKPIFKGGLNESILKEIVIKLNCNCTQINRSNSENNFGQGIFSTGTTLLGKKSNFGIVVKGLLGFGFLLVLIPFFIPTESNTFPTKNPLFENSANTSTKKTKLEVYANDTQGSKYTNEEDKEVIVDFVAEGEWLAIPNNIKNVPDSAKGYLSPEGDPNFKPNTTPCTAPVGALIVRGENLKCKLANGGKGSFNLKPGKTVYFLMNDVINPAKNINLYTDNKGSITVNLSTSKVID